MPTSLNVVLAIGGAIITIAAVIKVVIPFGRWIGAVGRRFMGAIDNLAGRDERIDRATGKTIEGIPAIGDRFAGIEAKLDRVANVNDRLDRVESRVDTIESTQAALIAGTFERGADAVLLAVEKQTKGVIDVEADE